MKLKHVLQAVTLFALGFGFAFLLYKIRIPNNFEFETKIPKFTKDEQGFVRKNFCNIYGNIQNPEMYYVSEIILGDTNIITLYPLNLLQIGSNSNGTIVSVAFDGSQKVYLKQNGELIFVVKN